MVIELTSRVSASQRTHRQGARKQQPGSEGNAELLDLVDDLAELKHLIKGLEDTVAELAQSNARSNPFADAFAQITQDLLFRQRRLLDMLERASRWAGPQDLNSFMAHVRKECRSIKSSLREAYRQRGVLLCLADWQSPIYESSSQLELNRLSEGIAEHVWDYKRDGHFDALEYERQFLSQYANHLGSQKMQAYLHNCGMGASSTVLHWLAHEEQLTGNSVALEPMYFENLHLARKFFPETAQLPAPESRAHLERYLNDEKPSLVICDAVTNCGEMIYQDVETIIEWAATSTRQRTAVIIDSTCLPMPFLSNGLLKDMPENVMVFLIESLAKYHQLGMDAVTAGICVMHAGDAQHSSFKKTRARFGANIADSSVGGLPTPDLGRLTARMQRHCRNTESLVNELNALAPAGGVIESVSALTHGTPSAPWYRGTCFSLQFAEEHRSIANFRTFEKRVVELARKQKLNVALSTSFGFDSTRFYVTAPSTPFEPPFLRVSVGTETQEEVVALKNLIQKASLELAQTWKADESTRTQSESFAPPAKPALPVQQNLNSGINRSVFSGPEALKKYLSPAGFATPPLVELPADLNPFLADGVHIFAKMMPLVPLMNIKSVPAFSMLSQAAARGDLEGVKNVIESSSSNTVLSLSVIARLFGIDTTCAIVDDAIAPGLTRMLRLFGIEVYKHPGPGHELYGKVEPRSQRATSAGQKPGWVNPGQYGNPDNPEGFERWLAPDLWTQTQGKLDILSCALGTCGTMVGVSRGLRAHNPALQVIACCPAPGQAVPGPRENSQLVDVTFDWQTVANSRFELGSQESFVASIKLLRRGIMGGPSSGMNYAGLLKYLQELKDSGKLAELLSEKNGEVCCAFLCCDSPLPHVDEYFDALGDEHFPTVHDVTEAI